MRLAKHLTFALSLSFAPFVWAQPDAPTQQPAEVAPQPTLILRELLVIQADRYDDTANNAKLQPTALPSSINKTGREKSLADEGYDFAPMPVGLLTFQGTITQPITLRVQLTSSTGQFQAYFPDQDAIAGNQFLGWDNVRQAEDKQRAQSFGQQGAWLENLRNSEDRIWLQSRDPARKERFFLYDASFRFKPAIDVSLNNNEYRLSTKAPERAAPPLCILLHKQNNAWTGDTLAAPWAGTTPKIATKTDNAQTLELPIVLEPIKALLHDRGYNKQEINLAIDMIASAGLDKSTMSLVYVLPVGIIDEHIRLNLKPAPDKIIRTAIVVLNNVDPDLGSKVNALLDDLGSDQWIKRDRAQRKLIDLGQAAIKKVQQLKDHNDPEVALRARQILNAYDWKINGNK